MTKLKIGADTWIDEAAHGSTHGQDGRLTLNAGGADEKYALLHVAISGFQGATVQSAVLHVFLRGDAWSNGEKIRADLLEARFREGDTWHTYNGDLPSLPGPNQGEETISGGASDGTHVQIDITDLMSDAAAADSFFGLLLSTDQSSSRSLHSSESSEAGKRPYLTITYSQAPESPTNLAPAAFESARYPKVKWGTSFSPGALHGSDQIEYWVQTSATADEDALSGDSGWIASTEQQADLSDTAGWDVPVVISNSEGTETSWRVKIRNAVGAESAFSDWVTFTRASYLALTIDFPALDDDQVDATTPAIEWTLGTGVEQSAYQVLVDFEDPADGELGYDSGRVTDVTGLHAIPAGVLRKTGVSYVVEVRAWDDTTRDAPGETGYVSAVRTFTYDRGAVTAAVTALTATVDGPAVLLEWHRAAAPDSFVILANGEVIDDAIDPADVALGGGDYERRVLTVQAFDEEIEFEVAARVDATGDSSGNATDTATYSPHAIWLCWPAEDIEVELRGTNDIQLEVQEDGATFYPVGQRPPVRVGGIVRGYGGTASGFVEGIAARDNVNAMKARPPGSTELRLIFGALNIPVEVERVTVSEWPAPQSRRFNVAFGFVQVGPPWPA